MAELTARKNMRQKHGKFSDLPRVFVKENPAAKPTQTQETSH